MFCFDVAQYIFFLALDIEELISHDKSMVTISFLSFRKKGSSRVVSEWNWLSSCVVSGSTVPTFIKRKDKFIGIR